MDKFGRRAFGLLAAATSALLLPPQIQEDRTFKQLLPLQRIKSECWVSDEHRKNMKDIHTNTYVWGEGY
jgi:hypothetical protein